MRLQHGSLRLLASPFLVSITLLAFQADCLFAADLSPKTLKAYERYVKLREERMAREEHQGGDFLYIDRFPKPRYDEIMARLKRGEPWVEQIELRDDSGDEIDVPGGMIHHWVGAIFIPGKALSLALEVLRDYSNYSEIYKPQIVRSRLLSHEGDSFNIYMRMQKQSVVSVTLDTWYDIHFTQVDATHGLSRSSSTRIQQVEDAGTPHEHLDPVGHDSGYLWRINSYWRYEQLKNGILIEWEPISLSRPIPFLLAWFVKPLVRRIARETVVDMLTATRKAVLAEKAQQDQSSINRGSMPRITMHGEAAGAR